MAATCGYMAKQSLISRLNPFKWAQRSIISSIGPAKDWSNWKHLFLPYQAADVPVGEKTAQSVPAYFRALNVVSEQIASLPWSVHKQMCHSPDFCHVRMELWKDVTLRLWTVVRRAV